MGGVLGCAMEAKRCQFAYWLCAYLSRNEVFARLQGAGTGGRFCVVNRWVHSIFRVAREWETLARLSSSPRFSQDSVRLERETSVPYRRVSRPVALWTYQVKLEVKKSSWSQ